MSLRSFLRARISLSTLLIALLSITLISCADRSGATKEKVPDEPASSAAIAPDDLQPTVRTRDASTLDIAPHVDGIELNAAPLEPSSVSVDYPLSPVRTDEVSVTSANVSSGESAPLDYSASSDALPPAASAGETASVKRDKDRVVALSAVTEGIASDSSQSNGASAHTGLPENHFRAVAASPLSTFSIDVDNASYSLLRSHLNKGKRPKPETVRIEEMINYFDYDYEQPSDDHPFAFATEVADCPWEPLHKILRVALKGREIDAPQASSSNLVFLIDVSGSMNKPHKLALLKEGYLRLVDQLRSQDRVAIVVYAGAAGVVLEPTSGSEKETIREAIGRLKAGGSTAGGEGIELAYAMAKKSYRKSANNRVVLATDGDFNVGISDKEGLVRLIEEKRKEGIYLTVLGFGTDDDDDVKLEQLADNGNGNYYYIDRAAEAERVLMHGLTGTLQAIAKDVKLQLAFNPAKVAAYRLIGYENRLLAAKDFDDDAKDAGELGAGHTVTALYEIVPVGAEVGHPIDTTRAAEFRLAEFSDHTFGTNDLLFARLRYKKPDGSTSLLIEHTVSDRRKEMEDAGRDLRFAAAVAEFGLLLRGSRYAGDASYDHVITLAEESKGKDPNGYRKEFITLVKIAKELATLRVGSRE